MPTFSMPTRRVFSVTTFFLYALSFGASAEIYKWVDADGVTHYSDRKTGAPQSRQQVDRALPPVHLIEQPDPALSRVQQQAAREREAAHRTAVVVRRRPSSNHNRCTRYQQQLDKVQTQLRRGYREPRGNKLRERRRNIQEKINAEC